MKKFIDIITVLLLAVSFLMAYYTGFVGKNSAGEVMLATNLFAVISIIGSILLYIIGSFSTVLTKLRMNMLSVGSLIFSAAQFVCVVGVCVITSMLWMGMFKVDSTALRTLYLIFVGVILAGYVDSLMFADSLTKREQYEIDYDEVEVMEPSVVIPHDGKK